MMSEQSSEGARIARFATVSVVAGALDYAIAAALILMGVPNFVSIIAAIAIAGGLSFVAHEMWTFGAKEAAGRRIRLLRWIFLIVALVLFRYAILTGLVAILPSGPIYRLFALAVAFALSLTANYLVSRIFVFAKRVNDGVT